MKFFCVFVKSRKKFDKFVKVNAIKNKYIIDVNRIIEEEEIVNFERDKSYIKVLILQKISLALKNNKDIYYIPDLNNSFSIHKVLNIRHLLEGNDFNILLFYSEFRNDNELLNDIIENLDNFDNSQIIRDY